MENIWKDRWTLFGQPECQQSFNSIINLLINPPFLAYHDFNKEFYLTTDASGVGLSSVLSQINENGEEKRNIMI